MAKLILNGTEHAFDADSAMLVLWASVISRG